MNKESRNRIKTAVLQTLEAYGKKLSLPVPIKAITKKSFPNVRLIPYSTLMSRRGLTYEETLEFAGTEDAFTDYDGKQDRYLICYNDVREDKVATNRYRWNIAHELGHVVLRHHQQHPESRIFRNGIKSQTYLALEEEADMFAAYILVPHIVISCVADKNRIGIKELCKISGAASGYRTDSIKIWSRRGIAEPYDLELLGHFSLYVEKQAYSKSAKSWLNDHRACSRCKAPISRFAYICSVCGLSHHGHYELKENIVHYSKIKTDDQDRALECPVCHNTDLPPNGTFCVICGNSLINFCSAQDDPFSPCKENEPLPGHARFCPYCGKKSTFFSRGFLSRWDDNKYAEIADEDGELPF